MEGYRPEAVRGFSASCAAEAAKREGVVGDQAFAKALALVEKRMPQMSDSDRAELIRHFNVTHERLSKKVDKRDLPVKAPSSRSISRSAGR